MKRFILSDLHIGYPNVQVEAIEEVIKYITHEAKGGDEVWCLGDIFHIKEMGLQTCINDPLARKLIALAGHITTRLIPGNHDEGLGTYLTNPTQRNPIQPIMIVKPFERNGFFYCHGHESDPADKYLGVIPAFWDRTAQKTPGDIRKPTITLDFLITAHLVHSLALTKYLPKMEQDYHQKYKGIVLGHTHLPVIQQSPELPFLLNTGDMRDSASFILLDGNAFQIKTWNYGSKTWDVKATLEV